MANGPNILQMLLVSVSLFLFALLFLIQICVIFSKLVDLSTRNDHNLKTVIRGYFALVILLLQMYCYSGKATVRNRSNNQSLKLYIFIYAAVQLSDNVQ